jgi:hypothetical protein
MNEHLQNITNIAKSCMLEWESLDKYFSSSNITGNNQVNPQIGEIPDDLRNRTFFILSKLEKFRLKYDLPDFLINQNTSANFMNLLNQIHQFIIQMKQIFDQSPSYGGIQQIDMINFQVIFANGTPMSFHQFFVGLKNHVDALFPAYAQIFPYEAGNENPEHEKVIDKYRKIASELESMLEISRKTNSLIEERHSHFNLEVDKISEKVVEITNARNFVQNIDQIRLEVSEKLKDVELIRLEFDNQRKKSIEIAQLTIELDRKILEVENQLQHSRSENDLAVDSNKVREGKIDELTEKAETMLGGATVAGLAKSFDETYGKYVKQAGAAMWVFYGSVLLLLVATIPNAMYLIKSADENHSIDFPGILARSVIVGPLLILLFFTSRRYTALFALQREYAHRSTIAKAVNGFKIEAPNYQQEIAHAVFMTLQENPATQHYKSEKDEDDRFKGTLDKLLDVAKSNTPGGIFSGLTDGKGK